MTTQSVSLEEPLDVLPVIAVDARSMLGLAELILKEPAQVDQLARDPARQPELLGRFLALSLAGFALCSLTLVLLLNAAPSAALPWFLAAHWSATPGPALSLGLAYTLGLVAASGICLPSFYFLGLLAGVRVTWLQIAGLVLRGKSATAVFLVGVLPIYLALVLGLIIFRARIEFLQAALYLGLGLPFLAGLRGVWTICHAFTGLADTLPRERRWERECFLRRLTFSWAAVYTVVTPVMIYTLWDAFVNRL